MYMKQQSKTSCSNFLIARNSFCDSKSKNETQADNKKEQKCDNTTTIHHQNGPLSHKGPVVDVRRFLTTH